ncbi:hypothetical protein L1887_56340 [Cichorium endivia]|nr:hypothetical protein L1887_56340 [Cichorium endivia]
MADPSASRESIATSVDFRRIARDAGSDLRQNLQHDKPSAVHKGFREFALEDYEDDLKDVKREFEGTWRPIRFITLDASLDRDKTNEIARDLWALPLLVGKHNTVGQPLPVYKMVDLEKGDILLGYRLRS